MAEALRVRAPLEPAEGQVAADFTITTSAGEPFAEGTIGAAGGQLWSLPVNRLGEVFVQRPDGEAFRLELHDASGPVPLSPDDGAAPGDHLDLVWAGPAPGLPPADATATAHLDLTGDPLTIDPLVELRRGVRDRAGLTVHRARRLLLAERHNVICAAALGAFVALSEVAGDLGGSAVLLGTPAERAAAARS